MPFPVPAPIPAMNGVPRRAIQLRETTTGAGNCLKATAPQRGSGPASAPPGPTWTWTTLTTMTVFDGRRGWLHRFPDRFSLPMHGSGRHTLFMDVRAYIPYRCRGSRLT